MLEKTRNIKRDDNVAVSIGADLIIGFPWESEKDFLDTYTLVKDYGITKLHAFTFSSHKYAESVPAWDFPNQVNDKDKKDRFNRISTLAEDIRNKFIKSNIWKTFEVLIESVKNGQFKGWTENYIEVTSDNFEVFSWVIKRNEILVGKLK
jgi:tRNA A37 methylthiotransferase MiaB